MIAVGLAWDVWLILIGVFIMLAAGQEERAQEEEDRSGRRS